MRNDALEGDDMRKAGLDPCRHTVAGESSDAIVLSVLSHDEPRPIDEPQFIPGRVDYDFTSMINGGLNQVSAIEIPPCAIPSPVAVGQMPGADFSEEWVEICRLIWHQHPEVAVLSGWAI